MDEKKKEVLREAHLKLNTAISNWEQARDLLHEAEEKSYVDGCGKALAEMLDVSGRFDEEFEPLLYPE